MRILWLNAGLLLPLDKGGKLRTWHLMRHLAKRHQITYLSFADPETTAADLDGMREVCDDLHVVPRRDPAKGTLAFYADAGRRLFDSLPYAVGKYRSAEYRANVEALLDSGRFDLVMCDFLVPAVNMPATLPCPAVLFTHNVEAEIWRRHTERSGNPIARALMRQQWQRMLRFEGETVARFDLVLAVSDTDRQTLHRLYGDALRAPVFPMATGVDTEFFSPRGAAAGKRLVFTGSMDWLPNEDAMTYFCRDILPLIRAQEPDVAVSIVGRAPTPAVTRLAEDAGIEVTGRVDDVRGYIEQAAAYIVPIRIGGGTRLKIFEAMAMGKAVVSTTVGAEGLPVTHGENVLIADDPTSFARDVVRLLRDPARRVQLERAARQLVVERYDWSAVAEQLDAALQGAKVRGCGGAEVQGPRRTAAPPAPSHPRTTGDSLMRVSVFGLGYVGSVSAASFAADGHQVVGVDVNPDKVNAVNEGRSPIVEPGLEQLLHDGIANGRLRATTSTADAVRDTDLSLICVGTPSRKNGSLDLTYLVRVCEQIGDALKDKPSYHVVVVRSTVLPGTTHGQVIPALERTSGKTYGEGFGVSVNPEFLREGTALKDFRQPPLTLVGHNHAADAAPTKALYEGIEAPLFSTSIRVAEMMKYTSNTWHAVKVVFANEIGNLCKRVGIDSHEVMDIFCQDDKLNLSPYYLKPGFAFGGSCLPKDVRALQYRAKEVDLDMPLINSVLGSNRLQIEHAVERVVDSGKKRVGLLGFSFKAGTDDLRESPMVILAEALLGKGYELCIFDRNVSLARLVGANKQYIEEQIPHLSRHLCESIDDLIAQSEVIVVGNAAPEFTDAVMRCRPDQTVIDLVRLPVDFSKVQAHYDGICW